MGFKVKHRPAPSFSKPNNKGRDSKSNGHNNNGQPQQNELKRIYETPKTMLRKDLDVIEVAVNEYLEPMFNDYKQWRMGKAKRPDYMFNMLQDIGFVSVLPKVVKNNYDFIIENGEAFSEIIASAVSELTRRTPGLAKSKEMLGIYSNIYEELNEERIRRVFELELPGVEWADALKICIISHGSASHTMINTLRAIYGMVKTHQYDIIRKLFIRLYSKAELPKLAIYILLEKVYDKQRNGWIDRDLHSIITNLALNEIEKCSKDEILELMKLYCNERRRTEIDIPIRRRITMSSINKDDYPKINRAIKKLSKKNEMYKIFLDNTRVK
jgi:hypothetical protein